MKMLATQGNALIVGGSQGIGLGFVKRMVQSGHLGKIYATYRSSASATELLALADRYPHQICCLSVDVTDEAQIAAAIDLIHTEVGKLHTVISGVGLLHDANLQPEKSLRQVNSENLLRYFQVNSIAALLLAKHLQPLFRHDEPSLLATISAKVGSIGDNHLGGWYGYRASKAALNMFMRTVAIEYRRTCPRTIVVMLHPGTTDTRLSKPFQRSVPAEKLFSVDRTVTQLWAVLENLQESDTGEFFSWDGSRLPW